VKVLALIKNIIEIIIVLGWIVLFAVDRDTANNVLPLLIVLLFVNVDSKIGQIIKQLRGMK